MEPINRLKAVLIDVNGTLIENDSPTPGATDALQTLRHQKDIIVRILTNTSKESTKTLHERLQRIGLQLDGPADICTSLTATAEYVRAERLEPYYILSDDACTEFPPALSDHNKCTAVVVGLAPEQFNYNRMNTAFNLLMTKRCPLLAVHEGRYIKHGMDFGLGPGFITRGLEYSAGCKAIVIGKPHPNFFQVAVPSHIQPHECVMIGDEVKVDVHGALAVGMKAILVRTGKYHLDDEVLEPMASAIVDNFDEAVRYLIEADFYLE